MNCFGAFFIAILGIVSAQAREVPQKCMDGTMANFVEAGAVPTNQLSENLPYADYDYTGGSVGFEDKHARGKMAWKNLPPNTNVTVERIAEYRGHVIYRAIYRWMERGESSLCILLAYCDEGISVTRPFFIANDDQLSSVEAWITSWKDDPFGLTVQIYEKGNGAMNCLFEYTFGATGPRLVSRTDAGRGNEGKVRKY